MDLPLTTWDSDAAAIVVQGAADMLGWILLAQFALFLALALLFRNTVVVRRFWCPTTGRDVEVTFEQRPLAVLPARLAVKRCTAWNPPEAIGCDRRCTKPEYRLPSAPPLLRLAP